MMKTTNQLFLPALALAVIGSLGTAHGAITLGANFSYANGNLTTVSGGLWTAYSEPGNGPVTVTNNQVRLDFYNSEDVSIALAGAPYDTTNNPNVLALYSSFTLNCQRLPTAPSGTYFAFWKDTGTYLFRGRVFITTNGAAPGACRLGITSTNSSGTAASIFPMDLATNTAYTVVTRYNVATAESALWINPAAETDLAATNHPTDPCLPIATATYALRQPHYVHGVVYIGNLRIATSFSDLVGSNTPPLISEVVPQSTAMNVPVGPIPITVQSTRPAAGGLTLTALSSSPGVVPSDAAHLMLSGTGSNRFLTIIPGTNVQGTANITVSVSDGVLTSRTAFLLTVGAPTISAIPDQFTATNTPVLNIPFTVFDPDSDQLTLTVSCSNPGLFPAGSIVLGGGGSNRTVSLFPAANQNGAAMITINVTDGFNTNGSTFCASVSRCLGRLLSETFPYTTAPQYSNLLVLVPGTQWSNSSGPPQIKFANNAATLTWSNYEGVGAALSGGPFPATNALTFYAGFIVNFSALPLAKGSYFFMCRDIPTSTPNYRCKVFARTANAAPGSFRLGIANFEDVPVDFPQDLSLNVDYQVVAAYYSGLGKSRLWVNPLSPQSPFVQATDARAPGLLDVGAIGLRQRWGMGTLNVKHIMVSTCPQDVFVPPAPCALQYQLVGTNLILSWSNGLFGLIYGTNPAAINTRFPGAYSPNTNPIAGKAGYLRLVYP